MAVSSAAIPGLASGPLYLVLVGHMLCFIAGEDPVGHMKPFGAHRPPDPVDEIHGFPSAEEFMEKYVKHSKPLVFRGASKQFPAFTAWSEEYLRKHYAKMEFRLEGKREKEGDMPVGAVGVGRDTMEGFLDTYHDTDRYIVSELPTPMWNDVSVLPSLSCGPFVNKFVEIDMWLSGGGTSSRIHKDAYNTINCLINGTKEWKLIAYKYQDKIYQFQEKTEGVGGFSMLNVSAVDLHRFPLVSQAPWQFTTIEKGDCLYLPGSMWHQVKSFGKMNAAVAFLFSRFENKQATHNYSDCSSASGERLEKYVPLTEVDVDWQFPGHGEMTMGVFDFENGKEALYGHFNRRGKFSLKLSARDFKGSWQGGTPKQHRDKAEELLALLRKSTRKENVTIEDIDKLPRDKLRNAIQFIHPAMPENTDEYEYFYVDEGAIKYLIKSLIVRDGGILVRETFLKEYPSQFGGTKKYAAAIYQRLQGDGPFKEQLTEADVKARLRYAVYKFKRGEAEETGFVLAWNEKDVFQDEADYSVSDDEWAELSNMGTRADEITQEEGEEEDDNEAERERTEKDEF